MDKKTAYWMHWMSRIMSAVVFIIGTFTGAMFLAFASLSMSCLIEMCLVIIATTSIFIWTIEMSKYVHPGDKI